MKNIYLYFFALIVLLSACGDFLDETPKGTLIPKTVNDFGMMMDAVDLFSNSSIDVGPTVMQMMDDDVKITNDETKLSRYQSSGLKGYRWEDYLFTETESDHDYNDFYHVIYLCNYILNNLEGAKEGGQFTKAYVEGAARFHRAFSYFCLVNLYAKHYDAETAEEDLGVALILEANPNIVTHRATVAEVYEQIFEDVTIAEELLDNTSEYTYRPNKAAANALLARIYLYQGNYSECWKAARKAREITGAPTDYNQYFILSGSPDNGIFSTNGTMLPMLDSWNMPDVINYKGEGIGGTAYGDYNLSDDLIVLFDKDNDMRWRLFVTTYKYGGNTPGEDEPRISSNQYTDNKGLNVGEVYITEAEALCRDNDIDGALWALNELGKKRYSNYQEITERDPDKLLQLILDERRRECMFKGVRWFDLKRLNKESRFAKTITHTLQGETYTLEPNDNHYVLPIPLNVISINPSMEQNPR